MEVEIYLTPTLQVARKTDPKITEIKNEFKKYKETGSPGLMFGRFGEMIRPSDTLFEELNHVHILQGTQSYLRTLQMRPQFDRKSDSFLIFCPGFYSKNNILMIDIIWKNAHEVTENMTLMGEYIEVAKRFRKGY